MILKLDVNVKTHNNTGPNVRIWFNGSVCYEDINLCELKSYNIVLDDLQDINFLFVEHYGKNPNNLPHGEDIAVEIDQVMFDQVKLHRNLLYQQYLFPNWQFGETPSFVFNNCYLGYNGVWQFVFPKNPISWIMDYVESENFQNQQQTSSGPESNLDDFIDMFD